MLHKPYIPRKMLTLSYIVIYCSVQCYSNFLFLLWLILVISLFQGFCLLHLSCVTIPYRYEVVHSVPFLFFLFRRISSNASAFIPIMVICAFSLLFLINLARSLKFLLTPIFYHYALSGSLISAVTFIIFFLLLTLDLICSFSNFWRSELKSFIRFCSFSKLGTLKLYIFL